MPRSPRWASSRQPRAGFLFLDEVGDVELSLQGKLLKAVEDRTVRRVGGIRDRRINVRILAATNRDLERESGRERFRRDLYFRLAVILLRLPPLRERGEDILFLADHFLSRFAAKYGKDVSGIESRARDQLLAYPWPGNVRELSHVIERAVLWSRGPALHAEHLSLSTPRTGRSARPAGHGGARGRRCRQRTWTWTQWERSLIEQAIRESRGEPDAAPRSDWASPATRCATG